MTDNVTDLRLSMLLAEISEAFEVARTAGRGLTAETVSRFAPKLRLAVTRSAKLEITEVDFQTLEAIARDLDPHAEIAASRLVRVGIAGDPHNAVVVPFPNGGDRP